MKFRIVIEKIFCVHKLKGCRWQLSLFSGGQVVGLEIIIWTGWLPFVW